jgi:hypothetical protein
LQQKKNVADLDACIVSFHLLHVQVGWKTYGNWKVCIPDDNRNLQPSREHVIEVYSNMKEEHTKLDLIHFSLL